MKNKIKIELIESLSVLQKIITSDEVLASIENAAKIMITAIKNGNKIIACGNGGSMSDAMHFASELTGKYREKRKPIAAMAISDPSYLSCTANDMGYEYVFSRNIVALAKPDDVVLLITTSGNSENINMALNAATLISRCKVVLLTNKNGGKLKDVLTNESLLQPDCTIHIPYSGYADRIQEMHIKILHILVMLIEDSFKQNSDENCN